jgi:cytidine diphosphoramidate kinase
VVVWVIGLSGSGKTTLTELLYAKLKPALPNLVRLDGDILRALFDHDVDHTVEGRRRNARRLSMLSKFLADQNIHVIAAVLSIFPEWQEWNRKSIPGYAEVYVKVSLTTLRQRDQKDLYSRAMAGALPNVVGVDIPFPEPAHPDLIIDNDSERAQFGDLVDAICGLSVVRSVLGGA